MDEQHIRELLSNIDRLTPAQRERVARLIAVFLSPPEIVVGEADPLFTTDVLRDFGHILAIHHEASAEAFTKDKFEHALVRVLTNAGNDASLARRGNPGHDATVNGERWSLKTQADAGIRADRVHISKFMELGKGEWRTEEDLPGLRDRMLDHMRAYDEIFSLRCLNRTRGDTKEYVYELVEIPKALLQRASDGVFRMQQDSRQNPKPGYCTVRDANGQTLFELYFDGGTERKLQIKGLLKSECRVLATWTVRPA